jgi:hypothetical protein
MSSTRGSAIAEALVAAGIAAVAAAILVTTMVTTARGVRRGAEISMALDLASEQLERLRLTPGIDGQDVPTIGGVLFERSWQTVPGRGAPDTLSVVVRRGGVTRAALHTEVQR